MHNPLSFNPRREESTTIAPSAEHRIDAIQSCSSPLAGRTVVYLPTNNKFRKGWEILGITWLEHLDEEPFLAKAQLPKGWTAERAFALYFEHHTITIIDDRGQEQVKIWIKPDSHDRVAIVSFLNIKKKLLEQSEKKSPQLLKSDFKPVCYPGYEFYCSYDAIIGAIENWGKVEAILANSTSQPTFVVSFKKPIKFSNFREGIMANLSGGHGIWHTPFHLRGMYREGSSDDNVVLSKNMIAFSIPCLEVGHFDTSNLLDSQRLLPDQRLSQIEEEVGKPVNWEKIKEKIQSTFSESDKAEKLLEWVKQAGLAILEKGLYKSGSDPIGEYSVEEIVVNYTTLESFFPWQVVMMAQSRQSV